MKLDRLCKQDYDLYLEPKINIRALKKEDFDAINVSDYVKNRAIEGSKFFKNRFDKRTLFPEIRVSFEKISLDEPLLIHNYTGSCPVQTFEINPVFGCNVGCVYCLVDDGIHQDVVVYDNYDELVERQLAKYYQNEHYFYFSPKTEAFCEATLATGIAHKILKTFIKHYQDYPESKARLFIASKGGIEALNYRYDGESILDLFIQLKDKMQFNTSLSIFPHNIRNYLEPYASSIDSRLEAVKLCQEHGIIANSALVQPILINILNDERLNDFFKKLASFGIINFKPEFLTVNIENMVLMSQILEMADKDIMKKVFEIYFNDQNIDHIKQRGRTAPSRELSLYWINKMKTIANKYGITISICYWVRKQLNLSESDIPIINKNGFKCLGYQTKLFERKAKC